MKNLIKKIFSAVAFFAPLAASAQQTMDNMELLTVNENVTTILTSTEPVRLVDISTEMIAGDQPLDNIVRLKPKEGLATHADGDILGIVTVITETYRAQYALIYTTHPSEAVSDKTIYEDEKREYKNPLVSLSTDAMAKYARRIWCSNARYRGVSTKMHRMVMRLNNIYSVGEYFFIDFSVENKTNIRFDIDQLKFKLQDKKQSKATNSQVIELTPAFLLDQSETFRYGYRNVVVLKKMTFPNDKILTIELSEKQISGRNIFMDIDYEDVLHADSFDRELLFEE